MPKPVLIPLLQSRYRFLPDELLRESDLLNALGRPLEGWDGYFRGELSKQDAYVWKIHAVFKDGSVWEGKGYNGRTKRMGTVTLVR